MRSLLPCRIESLDSRQLLTGSGSSQVVEVMPPSTPVYDFDVKIKAGTGYNTRLTIETTTNGGPKVTKNYSKVPAQIRILSPNIGGLHTMDISIGNLNTLVKISVPNDSSNTVNVTTAGADVILTGGDNASNTLSVTETNSSNCYSNGDLPVEIFGGDVGFNNITLKGSGIIHGGVGATNQVTSDDGTMVYMGGADGSNIVSVGTGEYYLLGADNSFNQFTLGGGFNYVVGGDNANNIYNVSDEGCGIIIFGIDANNVLITESGNSLRDYWVIQDPWSFHCGRGIYGDDD